MDIETLREFITICKTMNFTTSAHQLHMDQSTLSKHIAQLEKEIGTELLYRGAKGVKFTSEGRTFLEGAIAVVEQYDRTVAATRKMKGSINTVRIGGYLMWPSVQDIISAAIAKASLQSLPIAIELYSPHGSLVIPELTVNDPYDTLYKGIIDMAILVSDETTIHENEYIQHVLYQEPFAVFVSQKHSLTQRDSVSLWDLKDFTFIITMAVTAFWNCVKKACRLSGFEPHMTTRIVSSTAEYLSSKSDKDVLCIPQSSAKLVAPPEVSGLVQLPIKDANAYADVVALYVKNTSSSGVTDFLDVLLNLETS